MKKHGDMIRIALIGIFLHEGEIPKEWNNQIVEKIDTFREIPGDVQIRFLSSVSYKVLLQFT